MEERHYILYDILKRYPNGLTYEGWDMEELSNNRNLPFQYVRENPDLNWNWITIFQSCDSITCDDMVEFKDKWVNYPNFISDVMGFIHIISIQLIELVIDELGESDELWEQISMNRDLPQDAMRKYRDKLYWPDVLASNYNLTTEFVDEMEESLDGYHNREWYRISSNYKIKFNLQFIDRYRSKLQLGEISGYGRINCEIIDAYNTEWDVVAYYGSTYNGWLALSINSSWVEDTQECIDLIHKYKDKFDWERLTIIISRYPILVEEFQDCMIWSKFGDYHDEYSYRQLQQYQHHWSESEYIDYLLMYAINDPEFDITMIGQWMTPKRWMRLSRNYRITTEILETYKDNLDYELLSSNDSVSAEFIVNNPDKPWDKSKLSAKSYPIPKIGRSIKSSRK
jgi:hypothetical protein